MKELSIEEKAKAYDMALEKAKIWYVDAQIDFKKSLENLFPVLKENDGEKIRKAIIECVKNYVPSSANPKLFKNMLTWLEKQGEQKYTYKEEPKFKVGDIIHKIGENTIYPIKIEIITDNNESYVCNNERTFITIKFQDEYELVEQKPTLWNEDDEIMLNNIIGYLHSGDDFQTGIDWLKSLKEKIQSQTKQKWSKDDERKYNAIIIALSLKDVKSYLNAWHITQKEASDWISKRVNSF